MSSEHALWILMRGSVGHIGHWVRIENRLEKGTPDVHYCVPKSTGWFELKHLDKWPYGERTYVHLRELKLEQVQWIEAHARAGGMAHIFLRIENEYMILTSQIARQVLNRQHTKASLRMVSIYLGVGDFPKEALLTWLKQ